MRFGYWLPVFGGWLRNVPAEQMEASWDYVSRLARRSEEIGFDLTLIAELNLNDIKGPDAPALDAWTTTAALAAVTERLELMVAVRPTFHPPALAAKQAANIDHISGGRLTLNVVSSWWAEEAKQYGVDFDRHDAFPASAEISSPATRPRSSRSEAVLFMKFLNVSTTALGATFLARSARPSCATTTSVLLGISLTGE